MMSKTEMRKLAQQSTRYGYYDHGAQVAATCPVCRAHIKTDYSMWTTDAKGKRMTKQAQARQGVFEHLSSSDEYKA